MINVTFVGNLTKDGELKVFSNNERGVINLTIASNKVNAQGDSIATFMDVKLFGKVDRLRNVLPYLLKGTKIAGAGELVQENWVKETPNGGEKRSKLVAYINTFEFVGGAKKDNAAQQTQQTQQAQQAQQTHSQQPTVDIDDEEIPF